MSCWSVELVLQVPPACVLPNPPCGRVGVAFCEGSTRGWAVLLAAVLFDGLTPVPAVEFWPLGLFEVLEEDLEASIIFSKSLGLRWLYFALNAPRGRDNVNMRKRI